MIINYSFDSDGLYPHIEEDIKTMASGEEASTASKAAYDEYFREFARDELDGVEFHEFVHSEQGILGAFFTSIKRYRNRRVEAEGVVLQQLKPLMDQVNAATTLLDLEAVLRASDLWNENPDTFVAILTAKLDYNPANIRRVALRFHGEVLEKRKALIKAQAKGKAASAIEEDDLPEMPFTGSQDE